MSVIGGSGGWQLAVTNGTSTISLYDHLLDYLFGPNYFDARTQRWPLTSWQAVVAITILYLVAVPAGQKAMANRKPFDVSGFAMWHNGFMTVLSLWMMVEAISSHYVCDSWDKRIRIWGAMTQPGATFTPACGRLARVIYIHYLSKAYEFTDTFIMVLKRNDRQITFLHLYHHATIFMCWWLGVNFAPGGDAYFPVALNSFVHVLMYSYYLVAGAKLFRIPLVFKKSITVLQMTQFVIELTFYGIFIATYFRPRFAIPVALVQTTVFLALFGNFYRKAYAKDRSTKQAKEAKQA